MIGEFLQNSWLAMLLTAAAAYLLGSVNSAIIVTKITAKEDIRSYGSGNARGHQRPALPGQAPALITTAGDLLEEHRGGAGRRLAAAESEPPSHR